MEATIQQDVRLIVSLGQHQCRMGSLSETDIEQL